MENKKELIKRFVQRTSGQDYKAQFEKYLSQTNLGTELPTTTNQTGGYESYIPKLKVTPEKVEQTIKSLEKVQRDEELTEEDFNLLEAIVQPIERPAIDIINDSFIDTPFPWENLTQYKNQIDSIIPSVGRVELPGHPSIPYGGTAFIVGPNLLLTNRHVAELFVWGVGIRDLRFFPGKSANVDLKKEISSSQSILLKVHKVKLIHPFWDAAFLEVGGLSGRSTLQLAATQPTSLVGRNVAIIGYPALDPRNNIELQNQIFNSRFGIKRLQPGTIIGNDGYTQVRSFGNTVEALTHDCSTLGGNSGSALLDLETGQIIGLHFAGRYLDANFAVPTWQLALDPKVVDLNVNFVNHPTTTTLPSWLEVWDRLEQETLEVSSSREGESLRVTGDWFERTSYESIALALRSEPLRTKNLLTRTLGEEEASELIRELAEPTTEEWLFWPDTDPALPHIVYIHGIMGGHLTKPGFFGSRLWLNPLAFVAGNLAEKLALTADEHDAQPGSNLQPDGHLQLFYGTAARKWTKMGFVVHEFSYDWRKSITRCADQLYEFIEDLHQKHPAKPFMIVAHSMGGVVSSVYAQRHPVWSERIERAVFLGSPLRGSFAPIEAVIGTYPFLEKLAMVSRNDDMKDMRNMAKTLSGLIDMLPDPTIFPDAEKMYKENSWPDDIFPTQHWLDQSLNLKSVINQSPILQRTTLLVSLSHGTVNTLVEQDGKVTRGPRTGLGDGTVPIKAALIDGVTAYKVNFEHSAIPKDPLAIQAVYDLAKTGNCSLERITEADLFEDHELPLSFVEAPFDLSTESLDGVRQRFIDGLLTYDDLKWLFSSKPSAPQPEGNTEIIVPEGNE